MTITKDIKYIGVNDHQVDLFEGQYDVPNGMAYNSYVILDEKVAVMDTVDQNFGEEWLSNLAAVLEGRKPDYLIVQHMEPDHSANIDVFLKRYPENNLVKIESARIKRIRTCGTNESPLAKELLLHAETILKSVNLRELTRRETDQYYTTLADVYRIGKRFDDAVAALDEVMPAEKFFPEQQKYMLELDRGNTEDAIEGMQKLTFRAVRDIIVMSSWYYTAYADDPAKVIAQNLFVVRLLEAVTGGEASPFDRDLCYTCECISYMYAKLGDAENSVEYFRRAMNYAARFDGIETMTYTHLPPFSLLDETGLDFYPHGAGSLAELTADIVKNAGEERREYVLIRNDKRVKEIFSDFT